MSRSKQRGIRILACLALLASAHASALPNDNFKFCYSPAFAGWRNFLEPCIDGVIDGNNTATCPPDNGGGSTVGLPEQGWANGFRYTFNNGAGATSAPDVVLLALAKPETGTKQHIDLGIQVKNDLSFDNDDLIVVAFAFGGGKYGLLSLRPNQTNAGIVPGMPQTAMKYFVGTGASDNVVPTWASAVTPPTSLAIWAGTSSGDTHCLNADGAGSCTWDVELRIELDSASTNTGAGAIPVPIRTYVGVSRVYHLNAGSTQDPVTDEFAWPPTNLNGDFQTMSDTEFGVPVPADWGKTFVGSTASCNGLSFGQGDLSISPSPQVGHVSNLTVKVHNNSIDGSTGTPIAANGVVAQFLHAPFGSSAFGSFQPAGGASAPTNIPASSAGTAITTQWTPTATSGHECVLCRLSSSSAGTTFINAGEFVNTSVAPLSSATVSPIISMAGSQPRQGGGPQKLRVASAMNFQFAYADGSLAEIPAGTLVAELNWRFLPSRDTGKTITISKAPIPILEPMPGYGISYQHALLPDFQKAFEARHTRELAVYMRTKAANAVEVNQALMYKNVNNVLAGVDEKPDPKSFQVDVKGLTPIAAGNPIYTVEIPEGGQLTVPTSSSYSDGPNPPVCTGCFCCLQTKSTPAFLLFTGTLMGLAGFFAHRKKKS